MINIRIEESAKVKIGLSFVDQRAKSGDEEQQSLLCPSKATVGAAGLDLVASVEEPTVIKPGTWEKIPTGIAVALPAGYEGQVRPRSGLAAKHGVTVLNAPGTIDSDYRGEVAVLLINHGQEAFQVERGMRVAQLVVAPVSTVEIEVFDRLPSTERGSGGFGSSGLRADQEMNSMELNAQ